MDITLERVLSLIPKNKNGKYQHGEKKKFCEKIGAPTNIINEWERGTSKSYRNYLYAIADKYNVSVEWLKGETEIREKPAPKNGDGLSEEERIMLEKFRSMSFDDKKAILRIMNGLTEK